MIDLYSLFTFVGIHKIDTHLTRTNASNVMATTTRQRTSSSCCNVKLVKTRITSVNTPSTIQFCLEGGEAGPV